MVDEIVFERHFIENPYEPLRRPIERADFNAPAWRRMGRLAVDIAEEHSPWAVWRCSFGEANSI